MNRHTRRDAPAAMRLASHAHAGFTMVELIVALTIFGLVAASGYGVLERQQRFYRDAAAIQDVRSQLRQAASILPVDLRSLSSVGGDLLKMSDTSLVFRSTVGSSIACVIQGGAAPRLILPPFTLGRGNLLTSWIATPAAGDTAYVFDDGPSTATSDDQWRGYAISSVTETVGGCPASTGFTTVADATRPSFTVTLAGTLSPTILVGAPVRFTRRAQYALYRPTPGGGSYLGYCSPACTVASPMAPLAGPLRPSGTGAARTPGVQFSYFDADGAATAIPSRVVRVQVLFRAASSEPIRLGTSTQRTFTDSLPTTVAIRNWK